ncbi:MAG TPA: long-chain fatty acid--CoA ligase [Firmicutes bacterium]|jgi:long-chain acyl-CoA synthetase|nr:long-chain fatty acid--CoA ligase [Bacillota bacterium]
MDPQQERRFFLKQVWLKSYENGITSNLEYPAMTLSEMLHRTTLRFPDQNALIYLEHQWTYQELDILVSQMANLLISLGLKPGERVGIQLLNSPQFIIAYFGILRAGGITVPINPAFSGDELSYIIQDSGMELLITNLEMVPVLKDSSFPHLKIIVTDIRVPFSADHDFDLSINALKLEKALFEHPTTDPKIEITPDSIANLQYTGGTTGIIKGATLTHRNLAVNAAQFRSWLKNIYEDGTGKFICVLPMFHIYAITTTMNHAIISGSSQCLLSKFDINELMRLIEKQKPNLFMGVPAMYIAIAMRDTAKNYDFSSIKACVCGSAPLPPAIQQKFKKLTGTEVRDAYGLSECSPVVAATPIKGKNKYGSIGTPIPDTEVKIIDPETGKEVEFDTVGEIVVKGPQVMKGYWNRPKETAMVLKDGWLHTGDLGTMDKNGYIFITDRLKDMINVGGEKVYPREIEDLLYTHPAVKEVAVIGAPHALRGEVPEAYVVLRETAATSERELRHFCTEHLSKYKVPHKIEVVDELPRSSVGKVLRRLLRDKYQKKQ